MNRAYRIDFFGALLPVLRERLDRRRTTRVTLAFIEMQHVDASRGAPWLPSPTFRRRVRSRPSEAASRWRQQKTCRMPFQLTLPFRELLL